MRRIQGLGERRVTLRREFGGLLKGRGKRLTRFGNGFGGGEMVRGQVQGRELGMCYKRRKWNWLTTRDNQMNATKGLIINACIVRQIGHGFSRGKRLRSYGSVNGVYHTYGISCISNLYRLITY